MFNFEAVPFLGKFITAFRNKMFFLEKSLDNVCNENIRLRFKIKTLNKEKINVVYLCHRPAVWGSLKTVYEAMKTDDSFDVKIVTIPNKKQLPKIGLNHEIYESEGADVFWKGEDVLSGYSYETNEWFDLRSLHPDYVCVQQPYDICRPAFLKSWNICKYAKMFYIPYFTFLSNKMDDFVNDECNPIDFLKNLSFYFTQGEDAFLYVSKRLKITGNDNCQVVKSGFPVFDEINNSINNESNWNYPNEKKFRVIWTPRWCTNENSCNFFEYKDLLIDYCRNKSDIDFIFRPHPQAFRNWISEKKMTEYELNEYKNIFSSSENMKIDNDADYRGTFNSASCLVTDISSIIPEFFLTGKPIIYCNKMNSKNTFIKGKGITKGFYWVENWAELKATLDMLRSGKDPLREKREELIKTEFYIPKEGAGYLIKEIIKKDFYNA